MNKLLGKKVISFVAFLMVFSFTAPSYAAASGTDNDVSGEGLEELGIEMLKQEGYSQEEIDQAFKDAKTISKYIETDDELNITFDKEAALEDGINPALVSQTKSDMDIAQSNKVDNKGELQVCKGDTGYYGPQRMYMLDNCVTNTIIGALAGGATLAGIAGLLISLAVAPAGVAFGAAGLIMGLGATLLGLYNNGAGVYVIDRSKNRIGSQPVP